MPGGRTLTVLVADIVESTRLNTGLGAERADEVRRMIFGRFDDATVVHAGTLIKTMGDGCLVTFPGASEGVAAGVDMVLSLERLARQVTGLKLRVGIAVGDVTEDNGDVFGDAVVIASRLCSAAAPGQVLTTDLVRELAGSRGNFEWERVGDLFLKGIEEPVATSAARAVREKTTRLRMPHPLRSRPGELFVGRVEQMETLNNAWKESITDRRRTVLVVGEPGVGKTRLVAAHARKVDENDGLVLFARCAEDLAVPYQPFADALRVSIENAPRDLLADHFIACGGELRRLFPDLYGPPPTEGSPELERLRLFDAVSDFLVRLAREQPVTLVLDDIHWAAAVTLQLLKHLITDETPAPLLILATYRDTEIDRRHPLALMLGDIASKDVVERVHLAGLNEFEMEWLIEAASGDDIDDDGINLARALYERTSGNPFFASQILRHMAEAGALVHGIGGWEGRTADLDLPDGVLEVVGRRLSRLGEETTETLALAAVAGQTFTRAVLARAAGIDDVDGPLEDAVRSRLLNDNGVGRYTFAHAIVRDALLGELTTLELARRHHSIAMAMLDVHGTDVDHVHDLAFHFCEAALVGDVKNIARFSVAAADECIRRADMHAAIDVLQRGWTALETVEPVNHEARYDVCSKLSTCHYSILDGDAAALEAAAASARALHSAERLIELSFSSFRWDTGVDDAFAVGLLDDALEWLGPEPSVLRARALASRAYLDNVHSHGNPHPFVDAALAVVDALGDRRAPEVRLAMEHIVMALIAQPNVRRVIEIVESFDDVLGTSSTSVNRTIYLTAKAALLASIGDRKGCNTLAEALQRDAERTGEPVAIVYTGQWRTIEALTDGRFADVPELIAHAFDNVGANVPNLTSIIAVWTVWLAYEEGRSAEVLDLLRMVVANDTGADGITSALAVHLVEAGLVDEAREVMRGLLDRLPTIGRNAPFGTFLALSAHAIAMLEEPAFAPDILAELDAFAGEIIFLPSVCGQGSADRFRGVLLSLLGRHDEAIAALHAAILLERRFNSPPMIVRSQYWLGRVLVAAGHTDDASDAFALAREGADTLGMAGVLRQVDARLAMLDTTAN